VRFRALVLLVLLAVLWPVAARAQDASQPTSTSTSTPTSTSTSTSISTAPAALPYPTINPTRDQGELVTQGKARPPNLDGTIGESPRDVYAPSWWGTARPTFELHGYFRTRAELLQNFSLGRHNGIGDPQNLWAQPLDNTFTPTNGGPVVVKGCGTNGTAACYDSSQATANLRLRLNPEIHISDNLRILSQIDLLDNLVLGSTPDSYAMTPSVSPTTGATMTNASGYASAGYNPYAPLGVFSTTQGPPTAGVNGFQNSVQVNRVWAEYTTPVGQLRFGRMGSQWGLGMVANSGDGIDSDYQSTIDRVMFVTGLKSIDLYMGAAYDFVSSGTNNSNPYTIYGGQPYDNANFTNVAEGVLFLARRTSPSMSHALLERGGLVLNGGFYGVYRAQTLDVTAGQTPYTLNTSCTTASCNNGFQYRGASAFIPDVWVQALWRKLRFEGEFASIIGKIDQTPVNVQVPTQVREFGLVTQSEYLALQDKLHLDFGFGWASGDPWAPSLNPGPNGLQTEGNVNGPISTFRFHPDYRVDLIFFRQILTRVEGAYYFRPSVDYDFVRQPNGQKFGGGGALIWSRASQFEETPGHKRDLGVELDFQLYYQASDGSLNDDLEKIGGLYAMLQYGVFFPLGGLDYLPGEQSAPGASGLNLGLSTAQTVRLFMGIVF
jgi:uncharacterized protein (TIGR04551 family)